MTVHFSYAGTVLVAASFYFLCASSVRAADDKFSILGEGTTSCGEWLDKRHETSRVIPEAAWVLGFLTAASQYHVAAAGNIAHGLDGSGVDHWIDNYCDAHPLDNIDAAASALVRELAER